MLSAQQLRDSVVSELGDLAGLLRGASLDRWINEGQDRLESYVMKTATVTIPAAAPTVALPSDFVRAEDIEGIGSYLLDPHRFWGTTLIWQDPSASVSAGTARLLYWASRPEINGSNPSTLPAIGDQGAISWALYRAYRWLASQRADYRRMSTISQANGVDLTELDALAERHKSDFDEAKATLRDSLDSTLYFG